jgi:Uma2 family endonuclease
MAILEKEIKSATHGKLRRFTCDEYDKMGEARILGESDELIHGVVVVRGTMKPWRWTCHDFDRMIKVGILKREERVELVEGEIITLPPIGPEHRSTMVDVVRVLFKLEDAFGPDYYIMPESQIRLTNDVTLLPDVAVAYGSRREYRHRDPGPSDLRLVVEVSNTSLRSDRGRKYRLYAQMGVPEYWIINLKTSQLEVYREPSGSGFAAPLIYEAGDVIEPLFAPGVAIAVADFLPASSQ